jgi:omega-amidase
MSTLLFTLIQRPLQWQDAAANCACFETQISSLKGKHEIVVLPETFNTGFCMQPKEFAETMNGNTVTWMREMAVKYKIILTGSIMIQENGQYLNRLIWMQPDGKYGHYDKRHLFSFGGEGNEFSAGEKRFITQVKGWRICTQICYDLRFPVWSRLQHPNEYDVLLYIANWPTKRVHAWKTLLMARAIENQCYVVAVNRTGADGNGIQYPGESCVINPLGEIIVSSVLDEDTLTACLDKAEIDAIRSQFPFQSDKDNFILT